MADTEKKTGTAGQFTLRELNKQFELLLAELEKTPSKENAERLNLFLDAKGEWDNSVPGGGDAFMKKWKAFNDYGKKPAGGAKAAEQAVKAAQTAQKGKPSLPAKGEKQLPADADAGAGFTYTYLLRGPGSLASSATGRGGWPASKRSRRMSNGQSLHRSEGK